MQLNIFLSAYLLTAASLAPLYGKLSDLIGRKGLLLSCIAVFLLGSALCGAAQSFKWLAICRGVQGIGAGGIMQLTQITISDIIPLVSHSFPLAAVAGHEKVDFIAFASS